MIKLVVVVTPPLRGGGALPLHMINAYPELIIVTVLVSLDAFKCELKSLLIEPRSLAWRGAAFPVQPHHCSPEHSPPQRGETLHIRHSTLNRRHSLALDFPLHTLIISLFIKLNKTVSLRDLNHLPRRAAVISLLRSHKIIKLRITCTISST